MKLFIIYLIATGISIIAVMFYLVVKLLLVGGEKTVEHIKTKVNNLK